MVGGARAVVGGDRCRCPRCRRAPCSRSRGVRVRGWWWAGGTCAWRTPCQNVLTEEFLHEPADVDRDVAPPPRSRRRSCYVCPVVHNRGAEPDTLRRAHDSSARRGAGMPQAGRFFSRSDCRRAARVRERPTAGPGAGGRADPAVPDPVRHAGAGAGRLHDRGVGLREPPGGLESAPRGGDLWIRYPDGTRKNLTPRRASARRVPGRHRHRGARAVRALERHEGALLDGGRRADAAVPVSGDVLLADLRGHGPRRGRDARHHARCRTSPPASTTSRRSTARTTASSSPPTGRGAARAHLYPQRDEYEEAPTVTGLWSLDPPTRRPEAARALAVRRLLAVDRQLRARDLHAVGPPPARPAGRRRRRRP